MTCVDASGLTLAIDASTYEGSVCIARGASVLAEDVTAMRGEHEERLMPLVASTLHRAGVQLEQVTRVVCGEGPGSFTSLRIAASIAKGIATGRDIPLHAVSSLALLIATSPSTFAAGEYIAVMDALRGELYSARCTVDDRGEIVGVSALSLIPSDTLEALRASERVLVAGGDGAARVMPHARGVVRLGAVLETRAPVELETWEPTYGRLAEAQVKWETAHGRPLPVG
jgi:tRNA threonylcarbamoyladenosine biosynthesis protein TsaB